VTYTAAAGLRVRYGCPVLSVDGVLGPGLNDFLSWAQDRSEPVPARCAGVALVLLVLRGARLRGGLPQPAAKQLSQVLREDLPRVVCRGPEDVAAYPRVLELLVDHQRAAGLLNAERHRVLHAAVRKSVPAYEQAVADPLGLTWPRLYGGLLRADGVDAADPQAVHEWLADYRWRPRSRRRAVLVSALDAPDGPAEGWVEVALDLRQRVEMVGLRTANAELHLRGQIQQWVLDGLSATRRALEAAERGRPRAGDPAPDGGGGAGVEAVGDSETAADFLVDGATAAGLSAALRGEFGELAPRADSAAGHGLVSRLHRHRASWRPADWSLPPVEGVPAEQFSGLVGASALLAAAVELAQWVAQRGGLPCPQDTLPQDALPAGEDVGSAAAWVGMSAQAVQEVWRVALAAGLLRLAGGQDGQDGQDDRVVAGERVQVWRDGSAGELLDLALDAFAAVVAEVDRLAGRAADAGVAEQDRQTLARLAEDLPDTLIKLYAHSDPESLARLAAVRQGWALPRRVDDAHPEDRAAPAVALAARLRPPRPRRTHLDRAVPPAAGTEPGSGAGGSDDAVEYRLPPEHELQRLLGFDDIDDGERAGLLDYAYWQALLLDRLDALGVVCRNADRVELTTLGKALLRAVLLPAGFEAPTTGGLAAADADTLLRRTPSWSRRVRLDAMLTWLRVRQDTDTAWKDLMQAAAAGPRYHRGELFELLGVWSYLVLSRPGTLPGRAATATGPAGGPRCRAGPSGRTARGRAGPGDRGVRRRGAAPARCAIGRPEPVGAGGAAAGPPPTPHLRRTPARPPRRRRCWRRPAARATRHRAVRGLRRGSGGLARRARWSPARTRRGEFADRRRHLRSDRQRPPGLSRGRIGARRAPPHRSRATPGQTRPRRLPANPCRLRPPTATRRPARPQAQTPPLTTARSRVIDFHEPPVHP